MPRPGRSAKSLAEMSVLGCWPRWLSTTRTGASFLRWALSVSMTLLALRRLARVGTAVSTISSEAIEHVRAPRCPSNAAGRRRPRRRCAAAASASPRARPGRCRPPRSHSPGAVSSAEIVVVFADDARQQLVVETVGLRQRLRGVLWRFQVEVDGDGAEGEIEIDQQWPRRRKACRGTRRRCWRWWSSRRRRSRR